MFYYPNNSCKCYPQVGTVYYLPYVYAIAIMWISMNKKKSNKIKKIALELEKEWMKIHNDWRTPVWAVFRDRAERILNGKEKR